MTLYSPGKARRSLIDTAALRVVSQFATVLGYIVLVRGMSKEDFGVLNLLYSIIPMMSLLASLGLEEILRRYQPEYLANGNPAASNWLVRFVASARFGTNVTMIALLLLCWNLVAPVFKLTEYRGEFAFFSLLVLLHFQLGILQFALASHMMHRFSVGSMALLSIAKLIGYAAWMHFGTLTLDKAILIDTVAYGIAYVAMRLAYRRNCLVEAAPYRPPPQERRRLVRYGLFNNFNDAGSLLLTTRTDNFFVAAFIDPVSVAVYAFYTRLNEMANNVLPGRLFENVVHPMFFSTPRAEADRRLPQYFSFLLNMNLLLQWPMFAFCLAYHAELVQVIFGGKYIEHSWLLPLVFAFATLNVIAVPVTLVAQYQERAGIILLSKVFAIYNVVAMIVLLPVAGLYGAAIASGSAQAFKSLLIWWNVRDRAVWLNAGPALLSALVYWGAAVASCYLLKQALAVPALIQMLLGCLVFCCAGLLYAQLRSFGVR